MARVANGTRAMMIWQGRPTGVDHAADCALHQAAMLRAATPLTRAAAPPRSRRGRIARVVGPVAKGNPRPSPSGR